VKPEKANASFVDHPKLKGDYMSKDKGRKEVKKPKKAK